MKARSICLVHQSGLPGLRAAALVKRGHKAGKGSCSLVLVWGGCGCCGLRPLLHVTDLALHACTTKATHKSNWLLFFFLLLLLFVCFFFIFFKLLVFGVQSWGSFFLHESYILTLPKSAQETQNTLTHTEPSIADCPKHTHRDAHTGRKAGT